MATRTTFLSYSIQKQKLFLGFLVVVFFSLLWFFSPSVRGSDQYWYVGDVERAAFQDGAFKTNSVFPMSLPDDISELPRPWVQNKPVSYLVYPIAVLTRNGHLAWLIFNTVCLFFTGFFISRTAKIRREKLLLFMAVFMFFPLNFYLASQALPEVFIMFLISAIHYLLLFGQINYKKIVLLGFIIGVLICQRPNYILLILFTPLFFLMLYRKKGMAYSAFFVTISLIASMGVLLFKEHLIKLSSVVDTIVNNEQGKSNMGNFFGATIQQKPTISELFPIVIHKFQGALTEQFQFSGTSVIMFYLVNLLMVSIVYLMVRKKLFTPVHLVCLIFIGIHLMTIVLFYNQYRYAASIIPSLFLLNISMLRDFRSPFVRTTKFGVLLLILGGTIGFSIGYKIRQQAKEEKLYVQKLRTLANKYSFTAIMATWNNGSGLASGYAFSPKTTFYFSPTMEVESWLATAKKLHTPYGIINPDSKLYKKIKPYIIKEVPMQHSELVFFEVGTAIN